MLHRNIPGSALLLHLQPALLPKCVYLPKQLHGIRAQGKAQMPCGGLGCWRDLLQILQFRNRDSETETHSNCVSLAIASTTDSLYIQDNFPGTTCDLVVTLSPCRIHHSNSEHVGSAQSTLEVL